MYNKLFTKILDSSIWLESTPTRIVWLTMIAVMDEDGFAQFAAVKNVAHRARVSVEEAEEAIRVLEAPDPDSSNPDNEGRRLERVPGGWLVLNAEKHRTLVTRLVDREQNRIRVQRHRDKKRSTVTEALPAITCNASEAEAEAEARSESQTISNLKNKLVREGVAATKANGVAATDSRSKHPIFKGNRFVVWDWQLEDIGRLLGPHLDAFGLDEFFDTLDQRAVQSGELIPQRDKGQWLQAQILAESAKRGLKLADSKPAKRLTQDAESMNAGVLALLKADGTIK